MRAADTNKERGVRRGEASAALALQALAWTLGDDNRAERLLSTTGLDPAELRARAGEPAVLAAALGFLEAHEPDLLACADALGVGPAALVAARATLDGHVDGDPDGDRDEAFDA